MSLNASRLLAGAETALAVIGMAACSSAGGSEGSQASSSPSSVPAAAGAAAVQQQFERVVTAWAVIQGASSQKLTATARPARRSAVSDSVRAPVNRQITITLASPSMALPSAHPVSAADPAASQT